MVEAAVNVAAEQPIERSAYGALLTRAGNRGPGAAPQNLYQAAGPDDFGRDDSWVALAVATDEQWMSLRRALGEPQWALDSALESMPGRVQHQDHIDGFLAEWCRERSADEVVDLLWEAGVPVGKVMLPHLQPDLPPLEARGFFEELLHPVIGSSRYSTLPLRLSNGPERWHQRPAPLLGEHNEELLVELGLTQSEIEALEKEGIIGATLLQET
jgi:crotonobetainyl-CoA:carnitine CoA-transferase CaiB-like acyl-CoA transferase